MRRRFVCCVGATLSLLMPRVSLAATTYYVATTGSDSAAGTEAAPFASVVKANSVAAGGDTVYIHGGTYKITAGTNTCAAATSNATSPNDANNSWTASVTANVADFSGVTETGLDSPRQADGSLPAITNFHLVAGSDLIDKGVDVGLPYSGAKPDLGCFETGLTTTTGGTTGTGGATSANGGTSTCRPATTGGGAAASGGSAARGGAATAAGGKASGGTAATGGAGPNSGSALAAGGAAINNNSGAGSSVVVGLGGAATTSSAAAQGGRQTNTTATGAATRSGGSANGSTVATGASSASGGNASDNSESGGCNCRITTKNDTNHGVVAGLWLFGLAMLRRRRSSRGGANATLCCVHR